MLEEDSAIKNKPNDDAGEVIQSLQQVAAVEDLSPTTGKELQNPQTMALPETAGASAEVTAQKNAQMSILEAFLQVQVTNLHEEGDVAEDNQNPEVGIEQLIEAVQDNRDEAQDFKEEEKEMEDERINRQVASMVTVEQPLETLLQDNREEVFKTVPQDLKWA